MMQAKKSSRALVTILKCGLLLAAAGLLLGLAPAGPASPNADNETLRRCIRPEQIIIDLVNLERARRVETSAVYKGICW